MRSIVLTYKKSKMNFHNPHYIGVLLCASDLPRHYRTKAPACFTDLLVSVPTLMSVMSYVIPLYRDIRFNTADVPSNGTSESFFMQWSEGMALILCDISPNKFPQSLHNPSFPQQRIHILIRVLMLYSPMPCHASVPSEQPWRHSHPEQRLSYLSLLPTNVFR